MGNFNKINLNFWKDRKVFVTGATGLLGSWLTKFLSDNGAEVVCLLRDQVFGNNFDFLKLNRKVTSVRGDYNDFELIDRIINEYEIETVFHLGAQTIVTIANKNPIPTLKGNINGTINILEACRKNSNVKRVIIASSDKAYGSSDSLPYDENTPLKGEHPYDVSKSCVDLIARAYFTTYNLPVCITRCGNLYGPGDLNFSRIVPGIIKNIFEKEAPIIRSNGRFIRSYFYVKDAAEAYIILAQQMEEKNLFGESFNFSTDEKMSVVELVKKIITLSNSKLNPKILDEVDHEIKDQYLSSEKAKNILNWNSKYSSEEGLEETIKWYDSFLNYKSKNILNHGN
jgi:CDP-glucose 4,6-dehydratase